MHTSMFNWRFPTPTAFWLAVLGIVFVGAALGVLVMRLVFGG